MKRCDERMTTGSRGDGGTREGLDDCGPALSGSLFCGWLRSPSVLMCEEQDWDVTGQGRAKRICGAGLRYNEQEKSFVFDFGGQKFTISKTAFRLIQ